jgi:putative pyruvate formate lyase activating enzyme
LIRHLVLPNDAAGTEPIIDFLADEISKNTAINIMDQYRPCYKAFSNSSMNRRPTGLEVSSAIDYAVKKGLRVIS